MSSSSRSTPSPPPLSADTNSTLIPCPVGVEKERQQVSRFSLWRRRQNNLAVPSLLLHGTLLLIHVVILVAWSRQWTHSIVFSSNNQKLVSFFLAAATTAFSTLYCAFLVFIVQKQSTRRDLHRVQTLSATHDNLGAWSGLGAAAHGLWKQLTLPTTPLSVTSTFIYLGAMASIHISTPAIFSAVAFNATGQATAATQGLPVFSANYNLSDPSFSSVGPAWGLGTLAFLPYAARSETPGLSGATIYEVPGSLPGATGNTTVPATTFEMQCGYTSAQIGAEDTMLGGWGVTVNDSATGNSHVLFPTNSSIISTLGTIGPQDPVNRGRQVLLESFTPDIVFYSTLPLTDAQTATVPRTTVESGLSVSFFRCSHRLVRHTAIVDAVTKRRVDQADTNTSSTSAWAPFQQSGAEDIVQLPGAHLSPGAPTFAPDWSQFRDAANFTKLWGAWYSGAPASTYPRTRAQRSVGGNPVPAPPPLSVADVALMLKLGLVSNNRTALPAAITLDALQTALGDVVASIFWTLGNVQPALGYTDSPDTKGADFLDANVMALVAGQTVVVMNVVKARVEVDLLAVIGGLVASTILLAISAQYLLHHHDYNYATAGVDIDGTGFLHAIWLYRNHCPELESEVLQVRLPNDGNLRRAGMARVRLAAGKHFEKGWGG